jgi:hypothetical protein
MAWWLFFDRLRTEFSTMSAAGLILAGCILGFAAAWLILCQQIGMYRLRIGVNWPLAPTARAVDLVFALFLDGKGSDSKSKKLTDAFLESGITGETIKMKVGSTNPLEDTFPISEATAIPPKGFIRLVALMNPRAPNQGLPNKEFLERWRKVWFNAVYEDGKPDRILFDETVMESYFPEIAGPHVTRKTP